MVMLTKLRRFKLVDERQQQAALIDFVIDLMAGEYPPITQLIFLDADKKQMMLDWEAVKRLDKQKQVIKVSDLKAGKPAPPETLNKRVLLRRNVLDTLVLDLQNRRATRANDLQLKEEDGQLQLRAADTSARAILRRVSRGLFAEAPDESLYDWKYVEFLHGDPHAARQHDESDLLIARLPPGEIALLSEQIPYLHAAELLTMLPDTVAADVLEALRDERQLQVFEVLEEDQAVRLLALMSPDAAADLIGHLRTDRARRYLELLPKEAHARILELLRYPVNTAGGIMTNDVVIVPAKLTVRQAREKILKQLKQPDFTHFVYIVEDEESRHLLGVVSLRELYVADAEQRLEEIMNPYLVTIRALDAADVAAYRVLNSALAALPVIGAEGQLLGVVTVDAAVAQVAPASWRAQAPRVFS
jgi:magnesium transporter